MSKRIQWIFVFILLAVVGYQARRILLLKERINILSKYQQGGGASSAQAAKANDKKLSAELAAALSENKRLQQLAANATGGEPNEITRRVSALKEMFKRLPEQEIPQMAYATDADWYAAVDGSLSTADDFRAAMARLRSAAETRFAKLLQPALQAYINDTGTEFPKDVTQLGPFFSQSVGRDLLSHYRIAPADEIRNVRMGGKWVITQATVIDEEFDSVIVIGPNGYGSYSNRH